MVLFLETRGSLYRFLFKKLSKTISQIKAEPCFCYKSSPDHKPGRRAVDRGGRPARPCGPDSEKIFIFPIALRYSKINYCSCVVDGARAGAARCVCAMIYCLISHGCFFAGPPETFQPAGSYLTWFHSSKVERRQNSSHGAYAFREWLRMCVGAERMCDTSLSLEKIAIICNTAAAITNSLRLRMRACADGHGQFIMSHLHRTRELIENKTLIDSERFNASSQGKGGSSRRQAED
ncbi:hypothetical protein EVAR_26588_1 [Eumeta japonica]|uniref:Uncharacterized protein n=1 Tax=Eumeta variegata TaxID=151549 RepID=A0A4C1W562_EUMVA|nr:hypothetical protein EVAR_26588_1 [Eumeta japonica]